MAFMSPSRSGTALTPAGFQVLLAVASGHTHGYAVMSFVEKTTEGAVRLGPGTLYRTLARLVADGLVTETSGSHDDAPHEARRRYYRLTSAGEQAAREEISMMTRMLAVAAEAGLAHDREFA